MACMYCGQSGDHNPNCPINAPNPERAKADFERGKQAAAEGKKYHQTLNESPYFHMGYFKTTALKQAVHK